MQWITRTLKDSLTDQFMNLLKLFLTPDEAHMLEHVCLLLLSSQYSEEFLNIPGALHYNSKHSG